MLSRSLFRGTGVLALFFTPLALPSPLHAIPAEERLSNLSIRRWGAESGLPEETFADLLAPGDGYVWLASNHGLVRFDGHRAEVFRLGDAFRAKSTGNCTSSTLSALDLVGIVDDILNLSKVEAGLLTFEKATVHLPTLCENLVALFAAKAAAKGVAVHLLLPASVPPYILTDPQRLRQILLNLVGNAVKSTTCSATNHPKCKKKKGSCPICRRAKPT